MFTYNNKIYLKNFYKIIDGIYISYGAGRFTNIFVKEGKKNTAEKHIEKVYYYIKFNIQKLPLQILLENLLKIKPLFNVGTIVIRGRERQFPILLKKPKRIGLAVMGVTKLIAERKEGYLSQRIINELLNIYSNKNHILLQRRDKIFKLMLKNRSNMRYLR